ncbi:MAG: fasciclin domain-containing protein [Bacteroidales bacterium]|nr:fasciclin domain-containing protein [Bacteroidales bacterium]
MSKQLRNSLVLLIFVFPYMFFYQGCNKEWDKHYRSVDTTTVKEKILEEMEAIPDISQFTDAVKQVGDLGDLLEQNRLYTVFAPNNEAFDQIDPAILSDDTLFKRLIKYHFISGKYNLKDFIAADLTTFNDKYLNFSFEDETNDLLIDDSAKIADPDYLSQNGMIQIIDKPLLPKNNVHESLRYSEYSRRIGESIRRYTEFIFDKEASNPVGTLQDGRTIYDSVFIQSNPLLYQGFEVINETFYGRDFQFINIENEKELFTVVIPENFAEAADQANQRSFLNSTLLDKDLAGPILSSLIYPGLYTREEIIEDIQARYADPRADSADLEFYAGELLSTQFDEEVELSNGIIYKVNAFDYDLSWLITPQGGKPSNMGEESYQNDLISKSLQSEEINDVAVEQRNIKATFFRAKPYVAPGESLKINFQPEGSPVPDGYLPDYGYAYGERSSGFVYGWVDGDVFDTRDRGGSDPVLATLNHMKEDGVNAHEWQIEVPNGDYVVSITAGDESNSDQVNNFLVEDVYVKDEQADNNFDWFDDIPVTVKDGTLTISPHENGNNQKLIAVEIVYPDVGQDEVDSLAYKNSYGEWIEFALEGEFYPVDYQLMIRGKNKESGTYKIEANDQEIADYNFALSPSGDLDTQFDEIGTVRFLEKKSSTNVRFTFLETHPGENKDEQYLWIREIKLVPILE